MKRQLLFLTLALIIGGAMALHDTDKNSEDRGSPAPNHSDVLPSEGVKAHKTISSHYASDADTSTGQLQMGNKQVVANDGITNKALFGYQQGLGLWGAFVAKPGIDVKTNTDLSQFIFNSSQNTFKIAASGTLTINANATAGVGIDTIVAHGLSITPIPLCFILISGNYYPLPTYTGVTTSAGNVAFNNWVECATTSTNLVVTFYSGSTNNWGTFTIKYYLLQETAN